MEADRLFNLMDYTSENANPKFRAIESIYNGYIKENFVCAFYVVKVEYY